MSADVLRAAAALMRSRAEVGNERGFPSPWSAALDDPMHEMYEVLCHADGSGLVTDGLERDVAEHVASWHPVVALAVADWIEAVGATWWVGATQEEIAALSVARAYLGGVL